jgi:aprataxin
MAAAGRAWLAARGVPPASRRVGFHSLPSLQPLHMHALSADLDGDAMKTKKHYLSFVRPFFVPADDVATALDAGVPPPLLPAFQAAAALRVELVCQFCGYVPSTMQHFKAHVGQCAGAHGME